MERVRGLYGIVGGPDPERLGRALLTGGCRLLQLRWKERPADDIIEVGRQLRTACDGVGALLIANDDPEIGAAFGADGVHLGQTDGPVAHARRHLPAGLVGRSTHTPDDVAAAVAEGADYLGFGPMYATPNLSRPKDVRGPDALRAVRGLTRLPIVAIGGITAANLTEIRAAGADAWAVIAAVADAADPVAATRALLG
ncbi:MAG: thiamine phosphate synthase [Deltaproteobacteria bacterium]|nr:thiamine phosphate synthase [Deltaproteobacteria bacterium]